MFDVRSDSRSRQTPGVLVEESPWFEQLNVEQRAAVRHPGGPLLILAGAGTGKTTTLCGRVAWLVAEGVAPERILLLTFTRRAAREMLQRARALVAMPNGARGVVGGTFHSVAHHFVRRHAAALGLPAGFGVLDAGDAADVLDLVREEHGHAQRGRRFPKKSTLLDIYSRTVNAQRPLSEVLAEAFPWCEEHRDDIASLFKAYTARKRALGVIDLDDLLMYWRGLASRRSRRRRTRGAVRSRTDRRVPGRQRPAGRHRPQPAAEAPGPDRGRRRLPGDLRLESRVGQAHPGIPGPLPRRHGRHPGKQLPLDPADPEHRERAVGAGGARVSQAAADRARGRRRARACVLSRRVRTGERDRRPRARGQGARDGPASAGRAHANLTRQRPARARAVPTSDPVRQVRRTALSRGSSREGPDRAVSPRRQPG